MDDDERSGEKGGASAKNPKYYPALSSHATGHLETDSEDTDLADEFLVGFEEGVLRQIFLYAPMFRYVVKLEDFQTTVIYTQIVGKHAWGRICFKGG